jgi:hypothetical protein
MGGVIAVSSQCEGQLRHWRPWRVRRCGWLGRHAVGTYSHVTAQLQRDAADQLDALFARGS